MKGIIHLVKEFMSGMSERKLPVYASSGCYYLFMSLVPIVMIFCCILPYTPLSEVVVLSYIDTYFSKDLAQIVRNIVNAIYNSGGATLTVSILLTAFSASASMKALMRGIDMAYDTKRKENAIIFSVRALVNMLLLVFAAVVSLIVLVYGKTIINLVLAYIPGASVFNSLFDQLLNMRFLMVMIMLSLIFAFLFTIMPASKQQLKKQWIGAIFTAIMWVAFSFVYSWYVSFSNKYGAYGFIGTIMVAMLWIYYCLFFMLIGGYINSFISRKKLEKEQQYL